VSTRGTAGLLSFTIPLLLSLVTLCPTAYWLDSGELIACASSLGIAHPSGYPLYVILGRLFSLIPIGETTERIASLSAFCAAGSCLFLYLGCLSLTGEVFASLAASLSAGFSLSLWDVSNTAEVYSLNVFFTALAVYLLLRVAKGGGPHYVCLLAYSLGLGMTNHLTLGALLPSAILTSISHGGPGVKPRRERFLFLLFLFLLGLSLYLFLPLRASLDPPMDWGDPRSARGLLGHVTFSSQSGYFFTRSAAEVLGMTRGLRDFYLEGFGLPATLLLLAGCVLLLRKDARLFISLLLPVAILTFFVVNFGSGAKMAEEQESFYLPSTVFAGLFIAVPLGLFVEFTRKRWPRRLAVPLAGILLTALPLHLALCNFRQVDKREDRSAVGFARAIYETMEKPALLLTDHTSLAFLFTYAQVVEGTWNDVVVLYIPLLKEEWYIRKVAENGTDLVLDDALGQKNLASLVRDNEGRFSIYVYQAHPRKVIPLEYLTPSGPVMRAGLSPAAIDTRTIESHRSLLAPLEADQASLRSRHYRANLIVVDLTASAIFADAGFPEEAFEEAGKALLLDPQSSGPYLMQAEIRERQGRREEARVLYREALSRDPENRAALERLAALSEEAGGK
jgi:hypothetical protein